MARPALHPWSEAQGPLRLEALPADKEDPEPKALCGYGPLRADTEALWLRFVQGRPGEPGHRRLPGFSPASGWPPKGARPSCWCGTTRLGTKGERVRAWIRAHNRRVKRGGGVRIVGCALPIKSPWREPHRALLGARQTGHPRSGPQTDGGRNHRAGLRLRRLRNLPAARPTAQLKLH